MFRNLAAVVVVIVIAVIGLGIYLGWFQASDPIQQGNRIETTVSVDQGKMDSDAAAAKKAVGDAGKVIHDTAKKGYDVAKKVGHDAIKAVDKTTKDLTKKYEESTRVPEPLQN